MNLPKPGVAGGVVTLVLVSIAAPAFLASHSRDRVLLGDAPRLSPEMARHLTSDGDVALEAFCRVRGYQLCSVANQALLEAIASSVTAGNRARSRRLERPTRRLCMEMESLHGQRVDLWTLDYLLSRSRREVATRDSLFDEWAHVRDGAEAPLPWRMARAESLLSEFARVGDERSVLKILDTLSRWERLQGHRQRAWERAGEDLALTRKLGDPFMAAEILGYMGWLRGDPDSTPQYYSEAMEVARRAGIPYQQARIAHFFMSHYLNLGRHAMMAEYRNLGCEYAKGIGIPVDELRFVMQALQNFSRYECWNLVEQELPYAQLLLRDVPRGFELQRDHWTVEIAMLHARVLLKHGDADEAIRLANWALVIAKRDPSPVFVPSLLETWGQALVEAGRPADALPDLDQALRIGKALSTTTLQWRARASQVRALLVQHRLDQAREGLDSLATELGSAEEIGRGRFEQAMLEWRLVLARGDSSGARAARGRAWERFQAILDQSDRSAEADIAMHEARELRDLALVTSAQDSSEGYALELAWRSLYRGDARFVRSERRHRADAAHAAHSDTSESDWIAFLAAGERSAGQVRGWARETGGAHLLFRIGEAGLERWTATADRLDHAVIAVPVDTLQDLVRRVRARLASEPSDSDEPIDPELRSELMRLSQALLPQATLRAIRKARPTPLLVTTEGFLESFPFAALSLQEGSYEPLVMGFDVASLRRATASRPVPATRSGLIVADPELSGDLIRRYPELTRPSDGSAEAGLVARLRPGSTILSGADATKVAITDRWEGAAFLYFASHLVRDPEDPYLTFIPLASAGSTIPHAARLEVTDVRHADLSRCRLVVLSSCTSGSPIALSPSYAAPSLADAFADAGTGSVVHTFWRIRNEWARRFTASFLDASMRHGAPAMTALSQATREAVRGPRGVRHPFSWAAYGILLGELPSENARMARVEQSASESLSPAASRAPAGLDSRAAIRVRP